METRTTTFLFFFFISSYFFLSSSLEKPSQPPYSSNYYASTIPPLLVALLIAVLLVFAVRTTVVTWITVMVLLAFAGKRRRVLVREGREITSDVAMYFAQVVLKERSLVAFLCATIVSLVAMAWLRIANQGSVWFCYCLVFSFFQFFFFDILA